MRHQRGVQFWQLATVSLISLFPLLALSTEIKEYCSTEEFEAKCGENEVLVMNYAQYGRMRLGRCVKVDFGFIGCSANMLAILDRKCSGRRGCKIRIPDPEMDAAQPCIGDLTRYLEASYKCVPLATYPPHSCHTEGEAILPSDSGYIARSVTSRDHGGTSGCPYSITVPEGRRINLTLYDFSVASVAGPEAGAVCQRYAVIRDFHGRTDIDICSSAQRVSHAYTSVGNSVEIRVLENLPSSEGFFLLGYEAFGCVLPVLYDNQEIVQKSATEVVVRCISTGMITRLECKESAWSRPLTNCSLTTPSTQQEEMTGSEFLHYISSLPNGFIIVVVVSIAVIVGLCVVITGLILFRKRRRRPASQGHSCAVYGEVTASMYKEPTGGTVHPHYQTYVHRDARKLNKAEGDYDDYIYSPQPAPLSADSETTVQYSVHSPHTCKSNWQHTLGTHSCHCKKHACAAPDVTRKSFNQDALMYFELEQYRNPADLSASSALNMQLDSKDEGDRSKDNALQLV